MELTGETESPIAISEVPILQWSGQRRFKYFFTGVIGPIGCFLLLWSGMNARVGTLWQSGELDVYLTLMLEQKALLPFMPLLVYSMLALCACCIKPRLASNWFVRIGVYGGGILSVQYLIFVVFATSFFTFFNAAIVGPSLALIAYVGSKLMPRARRIAIWQIMLLTTVVAVVVSAFTYVGPQLTEQGLRGITQILFGVLFCVVASIPLLNCLTYVRATFALLRSPGLTTAPLSEERSIVVAAVIWLLGFGVSLKYSLDAMLAEYAKLPTSPPNCYVSSAAACGHSTFVGVERFAELGRASKLEATFPVNEQMCRLKLLEFALAAFSPSLHRRIRSAYDFVGPHAAHVCRSNAWFADASYVLLKPVEFTAWLIQMWAGISKQQVRGIYLRSVKAP